MADLNYSWTEERSKRALDKLVSEKLVWIDNQEETEPSYWFPSLFPGRREQDVY
jgi:ESCRT-II complex subunit VPS22